jgi:cytochrome c biogenesis protein
MSAVEELATNRPIDIGARSHASESILSRFLGLLSSVRLGVTLLVLLGLACLIGMLVMQQNVDGFANYYLTLTPAQRLVYGRLKFFDIYHAWYFNGLLAVLSLNIILASMDRFPKTWTYITKPNLTVPVRWLMEQRPSASVMISGCVTDAESYLTSAIRKSGWRELRKTEKNGRLYIFAQRGTWNRLGAYAVHVALLTIFLGGFLTAQLGTTGQLPLAPGKSTNLISETVVNLDRMDEITKQLPFEITFTDIEQRLIRKDGPITAGNTIDWITRFVIRDETGTHEAVAQMNRPFDYRGYRFFQASFSPIGRARNIIVRATAGDGTTQDLSIPRNGNASLRDGTRVDLAEFRGNFRIGLEDPNEDTSAYPNPAAILKVTAPGSVPLNAYAFGSHMAALPVAKKAVAGYTFQLLDFEKVSDKHILSVQRDPGANVVYVGFVLLFLTLVGVFFFSHQRVWAVIDSESEGRCKVLIGGNTNRNQNAFHDRFTGFLNDLRKMEVEGK